MRYKLTSNAHKAQNKLNGQTAEVITGESVSHSPTRLLHVYVIPFTLLHCVTF